MRSRFRLFRAFNSSKGWLLLAAVAMAVHAGSQGVCATVLEDPSGTITPVSGGPNFSYAMTINDGSDATEPIGTVWFAWIPGQDYLATSPISESSPAGWKVNAITHAGSSDGYAIQWVATSAASDVPIGGSLSGFGFTTTDSPAAIDGKSIFFPNTPVLTTFAYEAGPFSDAGTEFTVTAVTPVPEPAAALAALAPLSLLLLRRTRRAV